jgi:hypothetical protein
MSASTALSSAGTPALKLKIPCHPPAAIRKDVALGWQTDQRGTVLRDAFSPNTFSHPNSNSWPDGRTLVSDQLRLRAMSSTATARKTPMGTKVRRRNSATFASGCARIRKVVAVANARPTPTTTPIVGLHLVLITNTAAAVSTRATRANNQWRGRGPLGGSIRICPSPRGSERRVQLRGPKRRFWR